VDFNGGLIEVPISFHGAAAGFDSLFIEGGFFARSSYVATGPDSGSITLDATVIYYTGLEPITDNTATTDRVFTINTSGDQQIRIIDDTAAGFITIDSNGTGGFESVTFPNPTSSLTINAGDGNDTITIDVLDSGFAVPIIVNGGLGDDRLVIHDGTTIGVTFNGGDGTDAIVNQAGASGGLTTSGVETFIDRPLLFIPGFAGSFFDDAVATLNEWLLNRGLHPSKLALDPLSEGYSDLIQSFQNIGYLDGTNLAGVTGTLFSALWDWRVPVAVNSDGANDGVLSDVTSVSLQDALVDTLLDSGVDYLAYWLDQATSAWQTLTGVLPAAVDMVTHSTGGLVARSYIQSVAYDAAGNLPLVDTLVQVAVPNQGTGTPFSFLRNRD
jgi:pimeloyl-ACP methyl ester carboxylesterase